MLSANARLRYLAATILTFAAALVVVTAQDAATPTVALGHSDDWGTFLATGDGMSLYLYVLDVDDTIACVEACTNNWIPLVVADADDVTAADGVSRDLLGTVERPEGTLQVTYGGAPLYTFKRDTQPGHTRGQALGGQFFLVSPTGTAVTEKQAEAVVEVDPDVLAELMSVGALTFKSHCSVCHGAEGQGLIGPALAGNTIVGDKTFIIRRILEGFAEHGMPPFAAALSDQQVASIATFVRASWGNQYSPVLPEEVTPYR